MGHPVRRSNVFSFACRRTIVATCLLLAAINGLVFGQSSEMELRSPMGERVSDSARCTDREFYGVGTLYRVKRNDTGAVRYALMDAAGEIMAFLAPSSKIELKKFVGKEIGVTARTFGKQEDVAPHVIVDEVTLMSLRRDSDVALASHQEQLEPISVSPIDGSMVDMGTMSGSMNSHHNHAQYDDPGQIFYEDGSMAGSDPDRCMSCGDGSCDSCTLSPYLSSTSCTTCGPGMPCRCQTRCGPPGWLWLRGEYLLWWTDGMYLPPLVTTSPSGTSAANAGVLGQSGTQILYGDETILEDSRSGFRLSFGGFLGPQRRLAWEGEYFDVGDIDSNYSASADGTGSPILARPFFNINPRNVGTGALLPPVLEDSQLVSYPGILTGTVDVSSYSRFNGAAGRFRLNCCCMGNDFGSRCGSCNGNGLCQRCGYPPYKKIDFTVGYRYFGLREGLTIEEDLTSLQTNNAGRFQISDQFSTRNDFNGGELGTVVEWGWDRWTLEALMRVAIGGTRQQVKIAGQTTISPFVSNAETYPGGLLAQPSNIGTYSRNEFTMIPEIGTTLGFYLTPRMRFVVGYNLIYWSGVVRPGDQIDRDVNPDQLAEPISPLVGPLRPEFAFQSSNFWAQGLNLGLDYRW